MKAKEWYNKLFSCKTDGELKDCLGNCLSSLIQDANKLIKIRRATSDKAIASCLNEVNDKWRAICILHENAKYTDDHPLHDSKLLKDGFKAAYVHENPNRGWYFDLKNHKNYVNREQEKEQEKFFMKPTLKLFNVTPYEEITKENITKEILENMYLIGHYHGKVSNILLMSLVHRARILRYWKATDNINLSDIEEMEKDPYKFFEERNIPI